MRDPYIYRSRRNYSGRRPGGSPGNLFRRVIMTCLIVGPLWMWAYHQDISLAVSAWQATSTAYDKVETLVVDATRDISFTLPEAANSGTNSTQTTTTSGSRRFPGDVALNGSEIESWVIEFTNQERAGAGLRPLSRDSAISGIARSHSENMARLNLLEHDIGGRDPTDRALAAGYNCRAYSGDGSYSYGLSENIYEHPRVTLWTGRFGFYSPSEYHRDSEAMAWSLVQGWMRSPGHRENILDADARRIGVGVAIQEMIEYGFVSETVFATQNFSACGQLSGVEPRVAPRVEPRVEPRVGPRVVPRVEPRVVPRVDPRVGSRVH